MNGLWPLKPFISNRDERYVRQIPELFRHAAAYFCVKPVRLKRTLAKALLAESNNFTQHQASLFTSRTQRLAAAGVFNPQFLEDV